MPTAEQPVALSMRSIVKTFGVVKALVGIDLEVARGEIHGLVGQNGAGKSTIIKILAGLFKPDAGTIDIDGLRCNHPTPKRIEELGVYIIHQDRLLVPTFTVGEALFLGHELGFAGMLDRRRMLKEADRLLRHYFGIVIPPETLVVDLTTAQQKIVQITRALLHKPKILVLDEPTAALVKREVDSLFVTLRRLRQNGISIVYVSHYMQEIEDLCDRVTVLRNGAKIATVDPKITRMSEIVSMMIARDIKEMFPKRSVAFGESALEIRGLGLAGAFDNVSLTVRRGEIVGLTGLLGSGAKELLHCIYGLKRATAGAIAVAGDVRAMTSPKAAVARGIAMVPEDRRTHGVALGLSVRENVTLASLDRYGRAGFVDAAKERRGVNELIQTLAIKTPGREALVRQLSGGNQQKVVLAKWLSRASSIYVLDEPTVAIDVGSKVEIYHLLNQLAAEGAGILMLSTDLLELVGMCDRIAVMYRGRITKTFAAADTTSDELLLWATGAQNSATGQAATPIQAKAG